MSRRDRARQCKRPSRHGSLYPTPTSQIGRSSRGCQNGRNSSIFGQRFITTFRPAASASRAASSLRTPICIQTTLAPILMASSVTGIGRFRGTEYLHHIHRSVDRAERRVDWQATDPAVGFLRVYGDHVIGGLVKNAQDAVTELRRVRAGSDHRDGLHFLEYTFAGGRAGYDPGCARRLPKMNSAPNCPIRCSIQIRALTKKARVLPERENTLFT